MSSLPTAEDVLDTTDGILPLPEVAQLLNVPVTRVHQLLRQQQLIAVERDGVCLLYTSDAADERAI